MHTNTLGWGQPAILTFILGRLLRQAAALGQPEIRPWSFGLVMTTGSMDSQKILEKPAFWELFAFVAICCMSHCKYD